MTDKRTRERQLAKQAALRHEERRRAKRRRDLILGAVGILVAAGLVFGGLSILRSDEPTDEASPTATPTEEPTGEPAVTGEVTPETTPPEQVACGGDVPDAAEQAKPQFDRAPGIDLLDPEVLYVATLETSCGMIELELDADRAPQTVASFVFLARQGYFDGLTFHRVVPGFVIQGGDPLGTGTGGPGYSFVDEIGGRMRYAEGTLAMANSGPNTNGSQFFIVSGPQGRNLDDIPNYTIFGAVADGMDVVAAIDGVAVGVGDVPEQAVYIERITLDERTRPSPDEAPADQE
jgi:cyclophilin family peptidyl-prolyl cis-trans isomerase